MLMDDKKRDFICGCRKAYIDPRCDHPLYSAFVDFLDHRERYNDQYYRYCNTFAAMLCNNIGFAGKIIRETGQASPIITFLAERGHDAVGTAGDLRYELKEASGGIDIVMSFEVMEHIKDQKEATPEEIALFNETGVRAFAGEITRVLKPGGKLIMTTPNANSLLALDRLVGFEPPCLFRPHVREYTRQEVADIFAELCLQHYETQDSFFGFQRNPEEARHIFERNGWSPENRGELHFCIFAKP